MSGEELQVNGLYDLSDSVGVFRRLSGQSAVLPQLLRAVERAIQLGMGDLNDEEQFECWVVSNVARSSELHLAVWAAVRGKPGVKLDCKAGTRSAPKWWYCANLGIGTFSVPPNFQLRRCS
jgi:hypothetical protein